MLVKKAEGIEVSLKLHLIASRNYEILGVNDKCKSNLSDAIQFDRYDLFDIFFLFNPFKNELYSKVIDKIMQQCKDKITKRFIICYGSSNLLSIIKYKNVVKVYEGVCPHRKNKLVIFTF